MNSRITFVRQVLVAPGVDVRIRTRRQSPSLHNTSCPSHQPPRDLLLKLRLLLLPTGLNQLRPRSNNALLCLMRSRQLRPSQLGDAP